MALELKLAKWGLLPLDCWRTAAKWAGVASAGHLRSRVWVHGSGGCTVYNPSSPAPFPTPRERQPAWKDLPQAMSNLRTAFKFYYSFFLIFECVCNAHVCMDVSVVDMCPDTHRGRRRMPGVLLCLSLLIPLRHGLSLYLQLDKPASKPLWSPYLLPHSPGISGACMAIPTFMGVLGLSVRSL